MADAADAAKASVDRVKSLITLLGDLAGKSEATDTATAAAGADTAGAYAAVAAYRKTARWILAAFSAVALIVFGTLPFANVTRLRGLWAHVWLVLGLALVGVGVILAVRAVASTMTPVSASLGELAVERHYGATPTVSAPSGRLRRGRALGRWVQGLWRRIFSDAAHAAEMQRLWAVLQGPENASHFGPEIGTVQELIGKIKEFDVARIARLPATQAAAVRLQAAVDRRSALAAQLEALRAELLELEAATLPEAQKAELLDAVRAQLRATSRLCDAARTAEAEAASSAGACGAELAETMSARDVFLFHRSMVVDIYGVSLVRAAFLRARAMLVVAAVLTLAGAVIYALALPADTKDDAAAPAPAPAALEPAPAVVLRLDPDSAAYRALPPVCGRDGDLTAYVISGADFKEHGPATVVLASGECSGYQVRVGDEEGTLRLK